MEEKGSRGQDLLMMSWQDWSGTTPKEGLSPSCTRQSEGRKQVHLETGQVLRLERSMPFLLGEWGQFWLGKFVWFRLGGPDCFRLVVLRLGGADWFRLVVFRLGGPDWFRPVVIRMGGVDWFRLVVLAVAGSLTGFRPEHFNCREKKTWSGVPNIVTTSVCKVSSSFHSEFGSETIEREQQLIRNSGCCIRMHSGS